MKNLFSTFDFYNEYNFSHKSSSLLTFLLKIKFLDKNPSHFIDANRFPNIYTYEQETIITHSVFEAQLHPSDHYHVTTLHAKRVIDQSYTLLSVNKTIVRCQN